jgi:hypothetical protein
LVDGAAWAATGTAPSAATTNSDQRRAVKSMSVPNPVSAPRFQRRLLTGKLKKLGAAHNQISTLIHR